MNIQTLLKQADLDIEFYYSVNNKSLKNACRVRLYQRNPQVVILTELKGCGMSVTNSVEFIIPQVERFLLIEKGIIIKPDTVYVEHYGKDSGFYSENNEETFDRVMLLNNRPGWSRLSLNEVAILLS